MLRKNGKLQRDSTAPDLLTLAGHPATHPLRWALPDAYRALPTPRLLKRLTRRGAAKRLAKGPAARWLEDFLADARRLEPDAVWALESLAWCQLLPRLACTLPGDLWQALHDLLLGAALGAERTDVHEDPVVHQLLGVELPLTLACVLPNQSGCRELVEPAARALSFGLSELLDGNGLIGAAHLAHFRLLLACWTRCALLDRAARFELFDRESRDLYARAVRQALRLSRADGTLVLSSGPSGEWCPDLWDAALAQAGGRTNRKLSRLVLPGRRVKKRRGRGQDQLPRLSAYSEWGQACVMRAAWSRKSPQFACLFDDQRLRAEVSTAGRLLWSGDVTPRVSVDGRQLEYASDWTELCWFTDKDVDYLELEIDCQDGWQIQRQMLLARRDELLLLADVVLGPRPASLRYELQLPLCGDVRCEWSPETREGLLCDGRVRGTVLPLALPEWRAAAADGALEGSGDMVRLAMDRTACRLYAPLLFDLMPRRVRRPRTWRRLTVAERLVSQPQDVAVGYRVQLGYDQWLIYRSLAPRASRSVLGQNLVDEFAAARFKTDGTLRSLIEVQ